MKLRLVIIATMVVVILSLISYPLSELTNDKLNMVIIGFTLMGLVLLGLVLFGKVYVQSYLISYSLIVSIYSNVIVIYNKFIESLGVDVVGLIIVSLVISTAPFWYDLKSLLKYKEKCS